MSLRLLIVEDDAATLELMKEILISQGAEVAALSDSIQAATRVDQECFAGIFVDLQMPGLDGFELTHRIRRSRWNRSTPIVVVTGCSDKKTMERAFLAGATFYIEKPVDRRTLTQLFKSVRGAMSSRRDYNHFKAG